MLYNHVQLKNSVLLMEILKWDSNILNMKKIDLTSQNQLDEVVKKSDKKIIILFKHSTRCSISNMVLNRIISSADLSTDISFYCLDLLKYRSLSNQIEKMFKIKHESPQLLLIKKGECLYNAEHNGITVNELNQQISSK